MYAMLCFHRFLLHFGKAVENSLAVPEKVLERDPEIRIRGDVISLGRNPRRGRKLEQGKTNRGSVPPKARGLGVYPSAQACPETFAPSLSSARAESARARSPRSLRWGTGCPKGHRRAAASAPPLRALRSRGTLGEPCPTGHSVLIWKVHRGTNKGSVFSLSIVPLRWGGGGETPGRVCRHIQLSPQLGRGTSREEDRGAGTHPPGHRTEFWDKVVRPDVTTASQLTTPRLGGSYKPSPAGTRKTPSASTAG